MSLALIQESAKEVRRLAIAGSPLAVGDFRLKKLITPLEQSGAKVPVFAQVAKAISDVVNGKEADSAANLLSLSTLLNAILYTQGQTGTAEAFEELPTYNAGNAPLATRTAARVLKPIIEALTTSGGGRFEIVKSAVDRGAFTDLRLIEPSIRALDDTYPELADLVAEKILPGYGPGIVPLLQQGFNVKGKRSDARRLSVLHRLDPVAGVELAKTALEEGSADVKEAAIACLGQHEECLPLVLEQANAKNKALRAAALEALAQYDRPDVERMFTEMLGGKSLELLAKPFRVVRNPQLLAALLTEGRRVFGLLLKNDEAQIQRYGEILECLRSRREPEVEAFLLECFAQSDQITKLKAPKNSVWGGAEVTVQLAANLYGMGTPNALEAILAKREVLPIAAFDVVLSAGLRTWTPARVYDEFSPLLKQKKGAGAEKAGQVHRAIWRTADGGTLDEVYLYAHSAATGVLEVGDRVSLPKVQWDPRWLDATIEADSFQSACVLARPGHRGAIDYFLKKAESKKPEYLGGLISTLLRCEYPQVTDVFLNLVKKKAKGTGRYLDYELMSLFRSAQHLPAADLPKLDAFAATLDEKYVDSFLEAIGPLRATQAPKLES